ncbi:MAG: caspase family protein, partial [Crocinitomicaceae bacterium]
MLLLFFSSLNQFFGQNSPELVFQAGHSSKIIDAKFSSSDNYILSLDAGGKFIVWDLTAQKLIKSRGSDPQQFSFAASMLQDEVAILEGRNTINIYKIPSLELLNSFSFNLNIESIGLVNDHIACVSEGGVHLVKWATGKVVNNIELSAESSEYTVKYRSNSIGLIGSEKVDWINSTNNLESGLVRCKKVDKVGQFEGNKVYSTKNGNFLLVKNGKKKRFNGFEFNQRFGNSILYPNYFIIPYSTGLFLKYDYNLNLLSERKLTVTGTYSLSKANRKSLFLSTNSNNEIEVFYSDNLKKAFMLKGNSKVLTAIKFSSSGQEIFQGFDEGTIQRWDLKSNIIMSYDLKPNPNKIKKGWQYSVLSIDSITENKAFLQVLYFNSLKKEKSKFKMRYKYSVEWDFKLNKIALKQAGEYNNLESASTPNYNTEGLMTASIATDNFIDLKNNFTSKAIKVGTFGSEGFIYLDGRNYYQYSKKVRDQVCFLYDNQVYTFDQFDIYYNRPDLIRKHLPFVDSSEIQLLKKSFEKRKANLDVEFLSVQEFLSVPKAEILTELNAVYSSEILSYEAKITGESISEYKPLVDINGVPINCKAQLINESETSRTYRVKIELSNGANVIQTYFENNKGLKTAKLSRNVFCDQERNKQNLYIVSLGSGNFLEKEYNLNYAEKDADDFIACASKLSQFENTYELKMVGKEVSKNALDSIQKFLADAGINDLVLVFFAGHGILSEDFDYYLSTYNCKFLKPEEHAINYKQLENVLLNVKSRKKVLFLDACHSGEVDKNAFRNSEVAETMEDVTFRSANTSSGFSNQDAFDLS